MIVQFVRVYVTHFGHLFALFLSCKFVQLTTWYSLAITCIRAHSLSCRCMREHPNRILDNSWKYEWKKSMFNCFCLAIVHVDVQHEEQKRETYIIARARPRARDVVSGLVDKSTPKKIINTQCNSFSREKKQNIYVIYIKWPVFFSVGFFEFKSSTRNKNIFIWNYEVSTEKRWAKARAKHKLRKIRSAELYAAWFSLIKFRL